MQITIYAEKFDVAGKIAASLSGFSFEGKLIDLLGFEKYKQDITKKIKPKGYIECSYEGNTLYVTWGQGHMCTLKSAKDYDEEYKFWSNLPSPFFPNYAIKIREGYDFKTKKPTGIADPWTKKQLGIVKELFKKSDYIINATDFDREGDLIFAYVYEYLGVKKPYKRMKMDSQTKEGLQKAYHHLLPSSDALPKELAGRGRSLADWIVGINLSVRASLKFRDSGVLSVGRVQTPTLNILVEREKAITSFVSKPFWTVVAEFEKGGETFKGEHEGGRFFEKEKAEEILEKIDGRQGVVEHFEKRPEKKNVPFLYNLTSLSMDANRKYGYTAAEVLNIAQSLYDKGYLTYPRTSSQHLTEDMTGTVDLVLENLASYSKEYYSYIAPVAKRNYTKQHFDTKKVESHYAIIPTEVPPKSMNEDQQKIYDLVAKSLIRIIYEAAKLERTEIITDVAGEKFKSSGVVIVDPQWLVVGDQEKEDEVLPSLSKGDILNGEYALSEGKTTPPSRFTDDTLLSSMRTAGKSLDDEELKKVMMETGDGGIGTEATRAGIIETVITRGYAKRKGKQIIPTEKGISLIELLPVDDVKSAELTALWEKRLREIEFGREELKDFVSDIEKATSSWCQEIDSLSGASSSLGGSSHSSSEITTTCPVCGKPVRKLKWGLSCSGYSDKSCFAAIGFEFAGTKISEKDILDIFAKGSSKKVFKLKKKDGGTFYAKLYFDKEEKGKLKYLFDEDTRKKQFGDKDGKSGTKTASKKK